MEFGNTQNICEGDLKQVLVQKKKKKKTWATNKIMRGDYLERFF